MPKMKTRKSVAKRFSKTATGKLKFKRRGLRHILEKVSSDTKRGYKKTAYAHKTDMTRLNRCLPGA